mgnify:CR=1 FL=1
MHNEKVKSKDLIKYGKLYKQNTFETHRGIYTIKLIKYEGFFYFYKMKDYKVVEIKKLV